MKFSDFKLTDVNYKKYSENKVHTMSDSDTATYAKDKKSFLGFIKKPGKNLFWAWILYQSVKGCFTTAFIWIPLIYMWLH